jgi:glycosyltransferase involved in cell wall biosynthesis
MSRLMLATDAWRPQVNGVVRSFEATVAGLAARGIETEIVSPEGFGTLPLPTYPDIRVAMVTGAAMRRRIAASAPDHVHIATEGPVGWAMRQACLGLGLPFTTSYHTRFPEYIRARLPVPPACTYAVLRHFHAAASVTLVSTAGMRDELAARGFGHLAIWPRGVDTELFRPEAGDVLHPALASLPRPIFLTVSRVAVEKNLEAFLALPVPGSKVVVGEGPARADLQRRFPDATFLGLRSGAELAQIYANADVFVFPSLTDTFGIVLLEAAASGLPIAAFPVSGPRDVVGPDCPGGREVAVLGDDLRLAALAALRLSREACRRFALRHSWSAATELFQRQLVRTGLEARRGRLVA